MRQNRDGSEAFSAGACVSAGEASVSASALFSPRLALLSALEFLVLSFCLPGFVFGTGGSLPLSPPAAPSSCLRSPLPLRLKCLSPSKSLTLHKLSDPPTESQTTGPQIRRRSPELTARGAPGPSWLRPASPARSHLVSLARAAAAAAIYARPGWSWSFKPRFPGARRGAARSLLAPAAANHTPLSPQPRPTPLELLRSSRPKAARVKPLEELGTPPASIIFLRTSFRHCWL